MKKAFSSIFFLTIASSLIAPALGGLRNQPQHTEMGYEGLLCKITQADLESNDVGRVHITFERTESAVSLGLSLPFKQVQVVPVRWGDDREGKDHLIQTPDQSRLESWAWEPILGPLDQILEASVSVKDLKATYGYYELWGQHFFNESHQNSNFLGYLRVRRAAASLGEFVAQNPRCGTEPRDVKFNNMATKPMWTKNIPVKLMGHEEPQLYDLVSIVGEGVDAMVVKATPQDLLNPVVALKIRRITQYDSEWACKMGNEIRIREYNIHQYAPLLSSQVQEFSGMRGLVMPYIDGPTLEEFLIQEPALSFANAQKILDDIYWGLMYQNLFDFSPVNVMLRREADATFTVQFIDFTTWEEGITLNKSVIPYYRQVVAAVANMVNDAPQEAKNELVAQYVRLATY